MRQSVADLREEPSLRKRVDRAALKILGAVYDLDTGLMRLLDQKDVAPNP